MPDISIISPVPVSALGFDVRVVPALFASQAMADALSATRSPYVALVTSVKALTVLPESLSFMVDCLDGQEAAMVYADYVAVAGAGKTLVQLPDP